MMRNTLALLLVLTVFLAGCASEPKPAKNPDRDAAPSQRIDPDDVKDAVPRPEPRAKYGNHSPYEVWGKTYTVMSSAEGYREKGIASWYGTKFHGRRTSSGEPYDIYKATAAHKTLPLPTYAEVTNLENGRKIVVKINDRGPFHDDRIIDLSYAAAIRLGIADQGTGRVEVRAITFDDDHDFKLENDTWLQAGAFSRKSTAREVADDLKGGAIRKVDIQKSGGLYKVMIGPYDSSRKLADAEARVIELGYERPHKVTR